MSRFEDRTEKATPRKRQKARREGQVARSPEIGVALSLLGALLVGRRIAPGALTRLGEGMSDLVVMAGSKPSGTVVRDSMMQMLVAGIVPFLAVAVVMAVVAGVMQSGFVLATGAAKPKLSHLDLRKGLQRFKASTMAWETVKATMKIGLLIIVVWGPIKEGIDRSGEGRGFEWWLGFAGEQTAAVIMRVAMLSVLVAVLDYSMSRRKHMKQQNMTKQEVKQEYKDQEGDPQVRGQRKRRAQEISRNRMISNVAHADVVIMNPTHYAVALKYTQGEAAPRVVAKGMGRIALKIRAAAYRHGVMVKQEPSLARALYRSCKLNSYVPSVLFEAVAVILAAAYRRRRAAV